MTEQAVAIIVASYKDKPWLERLVRSLYLHTDTPFELVIASDVSDEDTVEYIKWLEWDGWCKALFATERRWFSGTNNMGLEWALAQPVKFTHFLLLNSDVEVTPGWLGRLLADMDALGVDIVGCKTITSDGRIDHAGAYGEGFHYGIRSPNRGYWEPRVCSRSIEWVTGAAFMIRRHVLETIGLLDEANYPHIGSDREYCRAAREAGFVIGYSPVTIYHHTLSHGKEGHDGTKGI